MEGAPHFNDQVYLKRKRFECIYWHIKEEKGVFFFCRADYSFGGCDCAVDGGCAGDEEEDGCDDCCCGGSGEEEEEEEEEVVVAVGFDAAARRDGENGAICRTAACGPLVNSASASTVSIGRHGGILGTSAGGSARFFYEKKSSVSSRKSRPKKAGRTHREKWHAERAEHLVQRIRAVRLVGLLDALK